MKAPLLVALSSGLLAFSQITSAQPELEKTPSYRSCNQALAGLMSHVSDESKVLGQKREYFAQTWAAFIAKHPSIQNRPLGDMLKWYQSKPEGWEHYILKTHLTDWMKVLGNLDKESVEQLTYLWPHLTRAQRAGYLDRISSLIDENRLTKLFTNPTKLKSDLELLKALNIEPELIQDFSSRWRAMSPAEKKAFVFITLEDEFPGILNDYWVQSEHKTGTALHLPPAAATNELPTHGLDEVSAEGHGRATYTHRWTEKEKYTELEGKKNLFGREKQIEVTKERDIPRERIYQDVDFNLAKFANDPLNEGLTARERTERLLALVEKVPHTNMEDIRLLEHICNKRLKRRFVVADQDNGFKESDEYGFPNDSSLKLFQEALLIAASKLEGPITVEDRQFFLKLAKTPYNSWGPSNGAEDELRLRIYKNGWKTDDSEFRKKLLEIMNDKVSD